ncbi:hypothetical protein O3P69_017265 [Scylla paramamosain]|uniref:Uncharacterized protein n=1 Tax=Scylla paramamosain TaxID=85552 RepID=A0AAW0TWY8_SCYPA
MENKGGEAEVSVVWIYSKAVPGNRSGLSCLHPNTQTPNHCLASRRSQVGVAQVDEEANDFANSCQGVLNLKHSNNENNNFNNRRILGTCVPEPLQRAMVLDGEEVPETDALLPAAHSQTLPLSLPPPHPCLSPRRLVLSLCLRDGQDPKATRHTQPRLASRCSSVTNNY